MNFIVGRWYRNIHCNDIYVACECGWACLDLDERSRGFPVLFQIRGMSPGFRYSMTNIRPEDWVEVKVDVAVRK